LAHGRNLVLAGHLLKLGATTDYASFATCWNDDLPALDLLLKYGADVDDMTSSTTETPFLGAIAWSRFGYAEALLKRGANANAKNAKGQTAFHIMLTKSSDFEHFAMLARYGARADVPGPDGKTAANVMARKKDERFRKLAAKLGYAPAASRQTPSRSRTRRGGRWSLP
jgi:ankyrin repeat protein